MQRRRFLMVLAAGGAVFPLAACDRMPDAAVAPWKGPGPAERDPRLRALAWALLAPNPHNLQAWLADIRTPGEVRLHVDPQRLLPETDPPGRQVLIGCGAFVEILRMAAAAEGQRAEIELLPEGPFDPQRLDGRPFARVRFVADPAVVRDPLFEFVARRRTQRAAYEARVPDAAQLAQLAAAAAGAGITFGSAVEPARVARLGAIALEGYRVEFANPPTWQESARVFRIGADEVAREPSGLPLLGAEVWWGRKLGFIDREKLMDPQGLGPKRGLENFTKALGEGTPAWVWLASADNARATQLAAGRSYVRLNLEATRLGLAMHPNSQVLQEFPQMDALFARFHREVGVAAPARVQMLARVGTAPPAEPAPRRAVERLLMR